MIPYQDDCLCDWRTSSCATHGHLQIRHVFVSFVKLSRWLEGFARYTWTRLAEERVCSSRSTSAGSGIVSLIVDIPKGVFSFRQICCQRRRVDSATCLLASLVQTARVSAVHAAIAPRKCTDQHGLDECACVFTLHFHVEGREPKACSQDECLIPLASGRICTEFFWHPLDPSLP